MGTNINKAYQIVKDKSYPIDGRITYAHFVLARLSQGEAIKVEDRDRAFAVCNEVIGDSIEF